MLEEQAPFNELKATFSQNRSSSHQHERGSSVQIQIEQLQSSHQILSRLAVEEFCRRCRLPAKIMIT